MPIKPIKKSILYENKWVRFCRDEVEFANRTVGEYCYTERVDAGPMIIPLTPDGKVVILKEWRYPIAVLTYNFPFGGVEHGESFLQAAQRELQEETGLVSNDWQQIGNIQIDPGGNSQTTPVFVAQGCVQKFTLQLENSEEHEILILAPSEIQTMIKNGVITNGWLLAGWSLLKSLS